MGWGKRNIDCVMPDGVYLSTMCCVWLLCGLYSKGILLTLTCSLLFFYLSRGDGATGSYSRCAWGAFRGLLVLTRLPRAKGISKGLLEAPTEQ